VKKGSTPIPDKQKARVLAKKLSQIDTQENIALEEGISRASVIRIKPETVSPEVLSMAHDYRKVLAEQAKRNVTDGLDVMYERMYDSSSKLSEITGAVKISHDILQLQTNQPTQIAGMTSSPDHKCEKFLADILACRTEDGRSPTLEQGYQALMWAEIDVAKEVREQFIEEHRRKWSSSGTTPISSA
jgi:hypothetical protein